jgi:hypothetical protein
MLPPVTYLDELLVLTMRRWDETFPKERELKRWAKFELKLSIVPIANVRREAELSWNLLLRS